MAANSPSPPAGERTGQGGDRVTDGATDGMAEGLAAKDADRLAGSIAEVGRRLYLWARRSGAGLARVEFTDEAARRQVVAGLRQALAGEAIALYDIAFAPLAVDDRTPPATLGTRLADELLDRLRALPPAPADLAAALYGFNLRRDALAATAQRQIWWMPPHLATAFVQAVPDLASWFLVRLHLHETLPAPRARAAGRVADERPGYIAIVAHAGDNGWRDADGRLDPAARRRLAADYAARYARGVRAGTAEVELAPLRERAVEILLVGGLAGEAAALARQLAASAADASSASGEGSPPRAADGDRPADAALVGETSPAGAAAPATASTRALDPVADELFRRLAWLAPAPIPAPLLDAPVPVASEEAAAASPEALRAALVELERRALVRRTDDGESVVAHPDAQAVSRRQQREEARQTTRDGVPPALRSALAWVADAFVGSSQDARNWPRLKALAPHAETVAASADAAALAEPTGRLLNQLGLLLLANARYAEAEPLLRRALAIAEARLGRAHPNVAATLINLGQLLKATDRRSEAEPLMRRALAIDEASLGSEHPTVASDLNNLAQLLKETNRLSEAEPLMWRALAISEASLGTEHPSVARELNNLAALLGEMNRQSEAEPLMRRALRIVCLSLGREHPHTQIARKNTIHLLRTLGRSEDEIDATLAAVLAG
ncbi:tetratricopeptide repeat protein [Accumulibacter sp.]|uniref:tetratricopeptide repeat protein n=1 Tax=Accumulibacter sp. TaxID=2053492 RepID=UPI00260A49D7|nr:tetratricopeptide repeat protein [Accumulibacter sp.]